ncbi:MAG TPA: hypothetical protein VLV17_02565 [Anaeromyxobacteraceae bacterium]|nr:hypothetical protein [Anaeromyxobacteraceae bacterium]
MKDSIETKSAGTVAKAPEPKTLRELGMERGLARDFEFAFRLLGAVEGDRVIGYSFKTPDGQRHALRVEPGESQLGAARAA